MDDLQKPLRLGFAPKPEDLPIYKKRYQVKYGYYFLSGLLFILAMVCLYIVYDLKETGAYFQELAIDQTIVTAYIVGLALVSVGMRLRTGFCVNCSNFQRPKSLDANGYCQKCGAHLFNFDIFRNQKEERSKHDLPLNERFLEMVKRGDQDAIRMLLYKGVKIDYQDKYGNSALMTAAMTGQDELIDLLHQYKASVDLVNNFGLSALLIAVDKGHMEVVEKLLAVGASAKLRTNDGRSARDIALSNKNQDMLELIERY